VLLTLVKLVALAVQFKLKIEIVNDDEVDGSSFLII
jgi:hypothetical protein